MAAFAAENPADADACAARWTRILGDETITKKTIALNGEVADHVLSFREAGGPGVSYRIGRRYWNKGLATHALSRFQPLAKERLLYARSAKDNLASIRVLEKCGFVTCGENRGFSNARRGGRRVYPATRDARSKKVGKGEQR